MFNIYADKEVCEDNFREGETGDIFCVFSNEKIATGNSYKDCLKKIAEYLECNIEDIEVDIEMNRIYGSRQENELGDIPSENEINKWKNNEAKLFNTHFIFHITEETNVNLKKFMNPISQYK